MHEAMSASSSGLAQFNRIFQRSYRTGGKSLDRGSLPTALHYLTERGLHKGKQRGQWVSICCPAHKSGAEDHPSMRVSVTDGHFKCMACGAKGGDLIALHRLITGLGFRDAVRDIGGRFHD
jgi:hypothetical protein